MDAGYVLIITIAVIAAILNIILFFKIWKMTTDVKMIKKSVNNYVTDFTEMKRFVHKAYFMGNIEKAYESLNDYLYEYFNEYTFYSPFRKGGILYCSNNNDVVINMDRYIEERKRIFERIEPLYQAIGKTIPDKFRNITYETFYAFGKKENIKIIS